MIERERESIYWYLAKLIIEKHVKANIYIDLTYANASDINLMKNDARKPNNFDYYLD